MVDEKEKKKIGMLFDAKDVGEFLKMFDRSHKKPKSFRPVALSLKMRSKRSSGDKK